MSIRGVILDIDGTLVDSNDAHTQAWIKAMADNGYTDVDYSKVRSKIGMGGDKLLPDVLGIEKDSPKGKKISESRSKIFKDQYLNKIKPLNGAKDLLDAIRQHGLKLAVATSAQEDELKPMLKLIGAEDLIEDKTDGSEAKNSKPSADVVEKTLKKMDMQPDEVLMLGDTAYDIESAAKTKVKTIALRSGGWKDEDLKGALAIYNDPADLLAHYDRSPLNNH